MIFRRFHLSPTNAFRTSDWEIPNCRAIPDGVTPALKAARTAFNFPCVKGTAIAATFSFARIFIRDAKLLTASLLLSEHSCKQSIEFLISKLFDCDMP